GRGDDDRGLRDHADRAAGRRAHHADEPRPPERRRRGHGGVRRHRRVSDPRVPLPATAATRRGYNPGARPGARGAVRRHVRAAGPAPGRGAPGRPLLREDGRVSLTAYLTLAALVFAIGLFGVLTRRNAIGILLGIELMLNAVNINLVAFARFHGDLLGLVFTLFTIAITVAEGRPPPVGVLLVPLPTAMLVLVTLVSLFVRIYSLAYLPDEHPASLGRYYTFQSLFAFSCSGSCSRRPSSRCSCSGSWWASA